MVPERLRKPLRLLWWQRGAALPAPASPDTDRITEGPLPSQTLMGASQKSGLPAHAGSIHTGHAFRWQGICGNRFSGEEKEAHVTDYDTECGSCWPRVLSLANPSSAPPHQTPLARAPAAAWGISSPRKAEATSKTYSKGAPGDSWWRLPKL